MPEVRIIRKYENEFYKSAAVIRVENGTGKLRMTNGECDYDGTCINPKLLLLNDKPLMQIHSENFWCSTCAALLSAGMGTENIDSAELNQISEKLNSEFESIEKSVKIISPLLEMLESGVYMVADVLHYPTDGDGNFFWNATNEKKYYSAACEYYYLRGLLGGADSFPVYLYPTQGTEKYNPERVEYYKKYFESKSEKVPRALAYSAEGFVSALLDGHHKSCAAALCGEPISCITIIPAAFSWLHRKGISQKYVDFGNLRFRFDEFMYSHEDPFIKKKDSEKTESVPEIKEYGIMKNIPDERYEKAAALYPHIEDVAILAHYNIREITKELIDSLLQRNNSASGDNNFLLQAVIRSESLRRNPLARYAALEILKTTVSAVRKGFIVDYELADSAVKGLKYYRDEEAEQMMIDLLVEEGYKSADLVKNYWD